LFGVREKGPGWPSRTVRSGGCSRRVADDAARRVKRLAHAADAVPDSVAVLRHAVVGYARSADVSAGILDDLAIAVSEAVTNTVVHAYAGQATGTVMVSASVSADELAVSISDGGRGMRRGTTRPGSVSGCR
jgi:anti-sigma regulatory factor (Ser/Thr protein kinase)